ncbi:hypothetical protein [Arthrobacter sp. GMC3]|uniref:hypothetical protein n=1 Tax=Arthrobacter sp. GMC3 TaxID=2058894 RepID=UPI000CE44DDE|nr:hypothetical protein [Arthrobacter sp. GMC3]
MSQATIIRRIGRREIHSPRSALSIAAAIALLAAVLWLMLETVLALTGNSPLLIAPAELAHGIAVLGTATLPAALIAGGFGLALLGIFFVGAAILPGNKARHVMANARSAVVVDRDVLASAIARTARTAARLAPEQVTASVGHRDIHVRLHPSSGRAVDQQGVREAVDREFASYQLARALKVTVVVAPHGAVGV